MNPRVAEVVPNDNFTLTLTFTNGETRVFDVKPNLDRGVFQELWDLKLFGTARVAIGTVLWLYAQDHVRYRCEKCVQCEFCPWVAGGSRVKMGHKATAVFWRH